MNSKTLWTPGPWATHSIYNGNKGNLYGWGINGTNNKGMVFTGRICDVPMLVPNHDALTQEANARLIADAPELVEALQRAVAAYDEICQSNLPPLVIASFAARFNGEKARTLLAKLEWGQA